MAKPTIQPLINKIAKDIPPPVFRLKPRTRKENKKAKLMEQVLNFHWEEIVKNTNIPSLIAQIAFAESMGIEVPHLHTELEKKYQEYFKALKAP